MSNQVYENSQNKYFAGRGVNLYGMPNNQTVAASGSPTVDLIYQQTSQFDSDNSFTIDPSTHRFTCQKAGMYAYNVLIEWSNSSNPTTHAMTPCFFVRYYSNYISGLFLNNYIEKIGPPTGDETQAIRYTTLTGSLFFNVGDQFLVSMQNLSDPTVNDLLVVSNTGSQIILSRLY